jgi:hypothetical protein
MALPGFQSSVSQWLKVNRLEFRFIESLHNTASFKKFEFLRPFSKAAKKTQSCFPLDIGL